MCGMENIITYLANVIIIYHKTISSHLLLNLNSYFVDLSIKTGHSLCHEH